MDQIQSVEKLLLPLETDKPVTVAPQLVAVKSTKEELIVCIKEWIKIDNDIARAKSDIKEKHPGKSF